MKSTTGITESLIRVNYSEIDQMGVVYHARYLVWLEIARTEHVRATGVSYAEMERMGYRLAVGEVNVRYRQPARYDDLVRVRCWVREAASRRIIFGYAVEHTQGARLLATAWTSLLVLDSQFRWARLPGPILDHFAPTADPVRL